MTSGDRSSNNLAESANHAAVKASALRDDIDFKSELARRGNKLCGGAGAVERHQGKFDNWKVGRLLREFVSGAMKLKHVLGDGVDCRGFDDGENPELGVWSSEFGVWRHG